MLALSARTVAKSVATPHAIAVRLRPVTVGSLPLEAQRGREVAPGAKR